MGSTLTYVPLNTGEDITEKIDTEDSFFPGINDVLISGGKAIFEILEKNQIDEGLYMGKLTHNEKLLLLIAQHCPVVNKWLLHVLVNNEKVSGGFNGVFLELGNINECPEKISVDLSNLNDIMNLNVGGKSAGNSFLTIGVN